MVELTPKPVAVVWMGLGLVMISLVLCCGGLGPLLDGSDDPTRGAVGQALTVASVILLLVGSLSLVIAFRGPSRD